MRKGIAVASVAAVVCATGTIFAQVQRPTGQDLGRTALTKNIAPLTPAQRARDVRAGTLARDAEAALNSGNFAEAEADARQSMAAGPDAGLAEETLAAALYAQGKTQEAFHAYKAMADAGSDFPRNLLPYALLSLRAGHWAQAAAAYDKALRILDFGDLMRKSGGFSPDVPQPAQLGAAIHIGMGLTLSGGDFHGTYQERSQQGLAHFEQALALVPVSPLTNYYHGYGLQRVGRWPEAKAAFQKAAALDQGAVRQAAEEAMRGR